MRLSASALLAISALSLAVPALAEDPAATTVAAPKPAKPKKTCRDADPSSTSRIGGGRVCHTQEEWDDIDAHGGLRQSSSQAVQSRSADHN